MDWPSVFAGATIASALIGGGLIPYLRLRNDRRDAHRKDIAAEREALRKEAREERERRLSVESDLDTCRDEMEDMEKKADRQQEILEAREAEVTNLSAEVVRLRAAVAGKLIVDRLQGPLFEEFARVFNHSRDLWLLTTPKNGGTVLLAMGQWEKIGISPADLMGEGWRQFIAPRSTARAKRTEERALDSGGRAVLWYRGKDTKGNPADWCLKWTYGRYNGETLAVATVIAYEPVRNDP